VARIQTKVPTRDTLTSVNADGSRYIIHPADVKGRYRLARTLVGYALIALFVALPWIPINGNPAVFLDVAQRRFHLFGATLAFQDTWLLFFVVSGTAFALFYVTALFGRVWCGWACPQTVYLDLVFRRIERWIEGDATARRQLDTAPWTGSKIFKRALKNVLFFLAATVIAHIFLSYFVSLPLLWEMMTQSPLEHWSAFVFVFLASAVLFANFGYFREQLCIVICPYGRFQSALIDDDSLNVAYDARRGDPPGKPRDPNAGDCIDCKRCVQVCPTGIDIRQGLQLECIGCTACIDACDTVMDKVNKPRGLIRYASLSELEGGKRRFIRFRTILYTAFLLLGAGVATYALSGVQPATYSIVRMSGMPFFVTDTTVRNQFQVRLTNKSTGPLEFTAAALTDGETPITVRGFENRFRVEPMNEAIATLVLEVPIEAYAGPFTFTLLIEDTEGKVHLENPIEFLGPDPELLKKRNAAHP
jgi:cytochrome c oxidase accessory protein FixG